MRSRSATNGPKAYGHPGAPWLVWLGGLVFLLSFRPFSRPVLLDPATWDYMSVALADGVVPYRDIFLHKTPAAIFVGAAGAAVASLLGGSALAGAHLTFIGLGAAGPALLYTLCRTHLGPALALAAAGFMLSFDPWVVGSVEGVSPKVLTTVLGLACLLAAERERWAIAGLFGGAATLAWQPGVAFLLGAAWQLTRGPFVRRWIRLCMGAAVVPALLLAWLAAVGGLDDFWWQAVIFNVHYIRLHARTPWETVIHLWDRLVAWAPLEMILGMVALPGLLASGARLPSGLAVFGLIYGAMLFISFQAWPDTILLVAPLAALLATGLGALCCRQFGERRARLIVMGVALILAPVATNDRLRPPLDFQAQSAFMQGLAAELDADDDVLVISLPEFLIHTARHSIWKWPYLWFGVDRFAAEHTPGGFDAMLEGLNARPPALILIARRWQGPLRDRFEQWAATRYTRSEYRIYAHTFRPIRVYRLRHTIGEHDMETSTP